ncbi:MAG: DNA replication/repair protein RecF, partial [Boseongicola sp.]
RAAVDEMSRAPERLGWKVTATLESLSEMHELATWVEGEGSRQVEIDGKSAPQLALGRLARVVWLVPVMDRLWLEGAAERRRFLDRMVMSFIPAQAEVTLKYEKAMRERNRLLKDNVRAASWYAALESQMAEAGGAISANRVEVLGRLQAAQTGAETAFPAAELSLISADELPPEQTAATLQEAFASGRARDMAAGRTLTGPHRADLHAVYAAKGVEAKLCSTGEQKALLVSLILSNARALAEDFGAPPILLLDEVAAHLDADRRAALYDEICALGAQAWMTGTGAELFESLGERANFIEVTEQGGISKLEEVS